ncbi:protein-glutamate methylesterase/protein-glutamine glutaminase [Lutibaculum baratangense]|uniref:Protein-glutamate methylesterase/protein-glutamine glutaminase n=1 Tax=Lutibaculum baratangense AMV1 TaxID=631454 RepID=V4RDI0_9HYPH|nr:chemotaxis response regulator protein-glutamate methylesterase [Lutibaculum baratangense]ESR24221.1 Chemotaxis response regulator protein-glutamate methylesterase CheB [Lutibaculum baratangense AMV1]
MTVKVLVVDDSPTMRSLVATILKRDPEIDVVGTAGDPLEARTAIKALNPDVITLDVEMPNMDGLDFLEKIMRLRPMPVIMVSTLTQRGSDVAVQALELGAFDCVGKPTSGAPAHVAFGDLAEKVKAAARSRVRPRQQAGKPVERRTGFIGNGKVVAIGSSTGGVEALLAVLSTFPENCPPTVITQHMPATFTASFAQRLDRVCLPRVSEARDGDVLEGGQIYLAPGGELHLEISGTATRRCRLVAADPVNGHRPSVDVLFRSVARTAGRAAVGVILTGMGRDGASGLAEMKGQGASTIGQDEASSVVYGMPRVAYEIGAVDHQLPLERIGHRILELCSSANTREVTCQPLAPSA